MSNAGGSTRREWTSLPIEDRSHARSRCSIPQPDKLISEADFPQSPFLLWPFYRRHADENLIGRESSRFPFAVMASVRLLCFPAVVLVVLSASSLRPTEASRSLWGKKLRFRGVQCLWRLRPEVAVPALEEVSVCLMVKQHLPTKWTGFVYKAPGKNDVEFGLGGSDGHLTVWLFGKKSNFPLRMVLETWYYFCVSWAGEARRIEVFVNGTALGEAEVPDGPPRRLARNGTLSLGVSHFSVNGDMALESETDLVGELSLFRVWSRGHGGEGLRRRSCSDGDVVSWAKDLQQSGRDCPPESDPSLQCDWSDYKIQMQTSIVQSDNSSECPGPLEGITYDWLKLLFPQNISIQNISVSPPSGSCHTVNHSALGQAQQLQALEAESNSSCEKCFSCEVLVQFHPAAKVDAVQELIAASLTSNATSETLGLVADPDTIHVLPVGLLAAKPPPTVSTTAPGPSPWPDMSTTAESSDLNKTTVLLATESPPTVSTAAPDEGLSPWPNMSTTAESSDCNATIVGPDTFFRVDLLLNITGGPAEPEELIKTWIKHQIEQHEPLTLLNPVIKDISGRNKNQYEDVKISKQDNQFQCTFHVQACNTVSADRAKQLIHDSLRTNYKNDSIIITTLELDIVLLFPGICAEEQTNSTFYGHYVWPSTFPRVLAEMICRNPGTERAYRVCCLDFERDVSVWSQPDFTRCQLVVTTSDLDNVTVTPDNVDEVVDVILELVGAELGGSEELSPSVLTSVVEKLSQVVEVGVIRPDAGVDIVNIVADILKSNTNMTPVAETVLNLTEKMGEKMDIQNESLSVSAPSIGLSMIDAERRRFGGLTFGVSSLSPTLNPEIFLNQSFVNGTAPEVVASISLPSALSASFNPGENATTRVHFQFYATDELFQDPGGGEQSDLRLVSSIVSASINNSVVLHLPVDDRVVVTFSHRPLQQPEDKVKCVFWDFHMNDGRSGWNQSGCETSIISPSQASCLCDHLTHFALLLDVSRNPISDSDMQILTILSFVGCGISCIFLGVTLLNYLYFKKLRSDYPSKILINLSGALLGLGLVFLVNSWLSSFSNYGLCIATAATLHYFLLASFIWMGLEAVHMYLALVKVFNTYVPSYILKFCVVGWGVPLLVVGLILAVDKDVYGPVVPGDSPMTLQSEDPFCWLQDSTCFYVTVVAVIALILLGNLFVFVVVLIQIRRTRAGKPSGGGCSDLRAVASLTMLLGLTWSMGLFSFGPGRVVMMYLFVVFNSFQGFFVFLFHCLMKESVRKQWRAELRGKEDFTNVLSGRRCWQTGDGRSKHSHFTNSNSSLWNSRTTLGSSDTFSSSKYGHKRA